MNVIFCSLHYQRWKKYGDPLEGPIPGAIGHHLPFAPLWAKAGVRYASELAERVGMSRRTVERWRAEGVPLVSADAIACALDLHPSAIWGPGWDELLGASYSRGKVSP